MGVATSALARFATEVGDGDPVTIAGASTRGGAVPGIRCVAAPVGVRWVQADEMTVCCGAGTSVGDLEAALAEVGQRVAIPPGGTVGGALSVGRSGTRRLGDGPLRDTLLQASYVSAAGTVVQAGGPTVKNVSGFDLCRLLVGARGTLGFLGEVILRTRPVPLSSQWFTTPSVAPDDLFRSVYRPTTFLWDGYSVWVLLEGHPADIDHVARRHGLVACDGPPALPSEVTLVAPRQVTSLRGRFVAEVGVGLVHGECTVEPDIPRASGRLARRIKDEFDPTGRLNPGVHV
jgi:glycolate oxidase FAD binding subunit